MDGILVARGVSNSQVSVHLGPGGQGCPQEASLGVRGQLFGRDVQYPAVLQGVDDAPES